MVSKTKYKRSSYTIADYFNSYTNYIEKDTIYDIDYPTFRSIVTEYFLSIRDNILEESKTVKLPCRLGTLGVIKKQPKNFDSNSLRVDFHETKIQGKLIYFINEHSNYYKYRIHWGKLKSAITNKSKYLFILSRANKRRLAQIIKSNEHDYVELSD